MKAVHDNKVILEMEYKKAMALKNLLGSSTLAARREAGLADEHEDLLLEIWEALRKVSEE